MKTISLALDGMHPVRDDLRVAFAQPDGVQVLLHRGGRPAWFLEMAWDGTETVGCGDRFYAEPAPYGFSLIATLNGRPAGYLSAELSRGRDGEGEAHIEMVQVDADHRGARIGSALAAGLAEILLRGMEGSVSSGHEPSPYSVTGDTQSRTADLLIARLQRVLDAEFDTCLARYEAGEEPGP